MSASAQSSAATSKAVVADEKSGETLKDQQKPAAALEEDDEFEDFPVEGTNPSEVARLRLELLINPRLPWLMAGGSR